MTEKMIHRKEIFKLTANGLLMIANGFVLAMIICLFLFQPKEGTPVKASIHDFQDNSQQYYNENEAYRQVNDNINTYQALGRPD